MDISWSNFGRSKTQEDHSLGPERPFVTTVNLESLGVGQRSPGSAAAVPAPLILNVMLRVRPPVPISIFFSQRAE